MLCLLTLSSMLQTANPVTVESLLKEMVSLDRLASRPDSEYTVAQASSYDRASTKAGIESWFANGDAGQFLRTESVDGRKEHVMADLRGPGVVMRVWSANPAGVLRFYFDNETKPRIEAKAIDLLGGKVKPFGNDFSYRAAAGWNLYFPIPYSKRLKVTVDGTDEDRGRYLYYHVGYRTYGSQTALKSFEWTDIPAAVAIGVGKRLNTSRLTGGNWTSTAGPTDLGPGQAVTLSDVPGPPAAVTSFSVSTQDRPTPATLRHVELRMRFDGETTVRVPLPDFFASAPDGDHPLTTFPMTVTKDGRFESRFVMPYRERAEISLVNHGNATVKVSMSARTAPRPWTDDSYLFHSTWHHERGQTRPFRDMPVLHATGEGTFVGTSLHVANPANAWWGEGDEKVYVDDETFPSTFGTGTEDYFGYAWSTPEVFHRPYHAQPRSDGPGNFGQIANVRWHLFDAIPFRKRIQFDIENWHWQDVMADFDLTAYWYAKPGTTGLNTVNWREVDALPTLPPQPVKGAIEGEEMKVTQKTGGSVESQGGFFGLSKGKQLWWIEGKVGDKLTLQFTSRKAMDTEVFLRCCHARDYAIQRISLNGQVVGDFDFYGSGVEWKLISLGRRSIKKGINSLTVEVVGANSKAESHGMFGLDYLMAAD